MGRKAKSGSQADEILKMMYPDLPTSDDVEPVKDDKDGTPSADDRIAALQAKIDALEGRTSAAQSRQPTPRASAGSPPSRPNVDWDNAPDPVTDPKGFAQFNREVVSAEINYEKQLYAYQQGQAHQQASASDNLWRDFSKNHADYAKDSRRVEIASREVIAKAKASGTDIDKYMFEHSDDFMKDTIAVYDELFGKPNGGNNDSGDDDDDDEDDNRGFITGGGAAGRGGPAAKQNPPSRYGELGAELKAWQEKTGFTR